MAEDHFVPKPGQVDYTRIRRAPVINCLVECDGRVLLVRRSAGLRFYPGLWNGISGFLDDGKRAEVKAREELAEEIGIEAPDILSLELGATFEQDDPAHGKLWIVHPVHVRIKTDRVRLDWEASEYQWVRPDHAGDYETVPGFDRVLATFFPNVR